MTPERVFKLYRAYKFYYDGKFDFVKYRGQMNTPPLIQQRDRQYYYRLAQKLTDTAIHALFTYGFFYHPTAHVSEFVSPDRLSEALTLSGRAENGLPLMQADIYSLSKRVTPEDMDGWLYGAIDAHGKRAWMPGCLYDVMGKRLPLDIACAVLLVPQKDHQYDWPRYWIDRATDVPFGPLPWVDKLKKLDQLLYLQRPSWRITAHQLAKDFWAPYGPLAPQHVQEESSLF